MFSNCVNECGKSGLLVTDISLQLLKCSMACKTPSDNLGARRNSFTYNERNPSNICKSKRELRSVNWSDITDYQDTHKAFTSFLNKFLIIYKNCLIFR